MVDLEFHLRRFGRRIRLRDSLILIQTTFWVPASLTILAQIVGRMFPVENLWAWTLAPFLVWFAAVGGYGVIRPQPLMSVASRVDLELGLKERLSTALALGQEHYGTIQPNILNRGDEAISTDSIAGDSIIRQDLIIRQRTDAIQTASTIHPAHDLPLRRKSKLVAAGLALTIIGLTLTQIDNPMTLVFLQQAAVREEAQEQAKEIASIKESIEESTELSSAQKEELVRRLEELAESLRQNPGDLEQAIADLSKFEEALRQDLNPNISSQQALLQTLSSRLDALTNSENETDAQASVSEALQEISQDIDKLDEAQREQLARNLAQVAAQAFQTGNTSLSQSLSDLAQAVESGDQAAIQDSASSVEASINQLEQQIANQKALQSAMDQAQASRQALSQAGRSVAGSQGQSGSQNPGSAQNPGQGAQPGPGGGSQANQLPPASGGQTNVRPQGSDADASLGEFDRQIYSPWERAGTNDQDLFIAGQESGEGETTTIEGQSPQPGLSNPALVPYNQVYLQYLTAATQAMQKDFIPGNLQNYVRDYFASIEPGN